MGVAPTPAEVVLHGTSTPLPGPATTVAGDVGSRRGANLFHSFRVFNILPGESVTFTAPAGGGPVANVVGRVTGGTSAVTGSQTSYVYGALHSAIPGASLWLINPHGIVFGDGALIDVAGAFHASTADAVHLADGGVFYADPGRTSVLSAAPPSAFGFLSGNPAPIEVATSDFTVLRGRPGGTLSLVGGDVRVGDPDAGLPGFVLGQSGGRVNLVSVGSGLATYRDGGFELAPGAVGGEVRLAAESVVDARELHIRGGRLVVDQALIVPGLFSTFGIDDPPDGGEVSVRVSDRVSLRGTAPIFDFPAGIYTFAGSGEVPTGPARDAPDITVEAGSVSLSGVANIRSERFGPGAAADVRITARGGVRVRDGAVVAVNNFYGGSGGTLTIDAGRLELAGEGNPAFTGLSARGDFHPSYPSTLEPASSYADSARTTIDVHDLVVSGGAEITSDSFAFGRGGDIRVRADSLTLSRDGARTGKIAAQSGIAGDAGDITVRASGRIDLRDGFQVSGTSAGTGDSARVRVTAGEAVRISGEDSGIFSATVEPPDPVKDGLARQLGLSSYDELVAAMVDFGWLPPGESDFYAVLAGLQDVGILHLGDPDPSPGDGGDILVSTPSLTLAGLARIDSSTTDDGHAGTVTARVGSLTMTDGARMQSRSGGFRLDTGALVVGAGNAGTVTVAATDSVSISGRNVDGTPSGLSTQTYGDGAGGSIAISARHLSVTDGATVSAGSTGTGLAGSVSLTLGDSLKLRGASVTTQAVTSDGGNITVTATRLIDLWDSQITTSVESGAGGGGNVAIDSAAVVLQSSQVVANAYGGPGGNIRIVAGQLVADPFSRISASSALGIDGTVNIEAPDTDVSSALVALPESYLDASSLLQPGCGAARAGLSSLVEVGRGGLPPDPGGYLWSVDVEGAADTAGYRPPTTRGAEQPTPWTFAAVATGCPR